jgi:hypothetical protein
MPLEFLAKGNFNYVFCDASRSHVFKVQQSSKLSNADLILDTPERSVRLWNQINAHLRPKAVVCSISTPQVLDTKTGTVLLAAKEYIGWSSPFIQGRNSTPQEITQALIDIYNRCGRVVLDGLVPGNFKTLSNGEVVCVDIGMSLRLQKTDEEGIENLSFASNVVWETTSKSSYLPWLKAYEANKKFNDVVKTTKALYVLQQQFPHYVNADFLKDPLCEMLKDALSKELDEPGSFMKNASAFELLHGIPILGMHETPREDACIPAAKARIIAPDYQRFLQVKLEEYSSSLPVEYEGKFAKAIQIQIFKNQMTTQKTINTVRELIRELINTSGVEEAKKIIIDVLVDLDKEIDRCQPGSEKTMFVQLQTCLYACGQGISEMTAVADKEYSVIAGP